MSLLDKKIIPGNHGKTFGTNAKTSDDLKSIKTKILELEGIKSVELNNTVFPKEFTIHTSKLVTIEEIEEKVKAAGFHSVPKNTFIL